ncbi:MAG: hypothetical protein PHC96_05475 [Firmicutes bacterium]|nr:hypothetical protein [Bacillota bacterium]
MKKRRWTKIRSSFISECFKTSPNATTTLFLLLTLLLLASCFIPFTFLTDRIIESFNRQKTSQLVLVYLLVFGVMYMLISLFTDVFKNILQGSIIYNQVLNVLQGLSPNLLEQKTFSFKDTFSELERRVLLDSDALFGLFGSIFLAVVLAFSISYFAPWAVLILALGAIVSFYLTKDLATPSDLKDNRSQAEELSKNAEWLFEAEYLNAKELVLEEITADLEEENKKYLKSLKTQNLIATGGKVIERLAFLLSIGVVGFYLIQSEATLSSLLITIIFGGLFQREVFQILFHQKKLSVQDDWHEKTQELLEQSRPDEDLASYLESQIRDKFELEEDLNLCVELRRVSFSIDSRFRVKNLSLSIFTGDRLAIVGSKKEQKAFLDLLFGIKKPDSGEVAFIDVDDGSLSRLRALRQVAYLALPEGEQTLGLTLREIVGFGDIQDINDNSSLVEAINKAGLSLDGNTTNDIIDCVPVLTSYDLKKLLYARAVFGERRFILIDASSFDADLDAPLLEEIKKDSRNTLVFLALDNSFSESVDSIINLKAYID